jgi:tRNA 2-thiocytidine biosynthesis protein TtcA
MKKMLENWDENTPGRVESIFASLQNIAPSQLADTELFDFMGLQLAKSLLWIITIYK